MFRCDGCGEPKSGSPKRLPVAVRPVEYVTSIEEAGRVVAERRSSGRETVKEGLFCPSCAEKVEPVVVDPKTVESVTRVPPKDWSNKPWRKGGRQSQGRGEN